MDTNPTNPSISKKMLWTGRIMSALPVLMLLMAGIMKLVQPKQVVDNLAQFGIPVSMLTGLGVLEILCAIVYVIPSTSILGAILVTGYMGGAVLTSARVGQNYVGAIIVGVLAWGGLYLRDVRLRAIFPFRK